MGDFDPAKEAFFTVTNRHGLNVFVKTITPSEVTGNVYLAHGFSDVHDTPHMRAMTAAFAQAGYRVIVWDATHSWGRSEGSAQEASFYYHHEDLEDVLIWSRAQAWYKEPFMLAGHSLGGMMAGTYAASHASQVAGLVLVSPVVSGPALRRRIPLPVRLWWKARGSLRLPGRGINRPTWEFIRSSWSYNLLASAHRLTMPVLIIGAGRDWLIPPRMLRRLSNLLKGRQSEFHIIPRASHGFDKPWEMVYLKDTVARWLRGRF